MTTTETAVFKGFDFEKPVMDLEQQIQELQAIVKQNGVVGITDEIRALQDRCEELKKEIYGGLTPWQRVQIARHPRRPYSLDYIEKIFGEFHELHGDRHFSEDKAIVGGVGFLDEMPVLVVGHQKGRTLQDSMARNFGMPHPEGYRKALRLMRLAARFSLPIVTFIDTAGAYPGIGAEERGQATAIAENLREMAEIPVPIVCCIIGEGGSGGALAIGVGNRLLMLENAWYSVISPEGCASILYRDAAKAPEAARALKLTATDLKELGIIDELVPEPLGGAHRDADVTAANLKAALKKHFEDLLPLSPEKLLDQRYEKFRAIGHFQETQSKSLKPARRKTNKASASS
ncbi:MAG TPA: acetyl-CoA carboxylase carboxyltransferase subunit alpha [Elusimicrobiota bacterium]|nr:acetyl-CoA carboxylase carboxyltransferase subunit alpha [Elusimicrobiota bacterium]